MSGASSSAEKPGKTMSSNLLTMKFMRRAAASKEAKSMSDDQRISDDQSMPGDSSSHSTKRARLSTTAKSPRTSDMDAISAALAAEEEKRQQAISRAAEEAGETHWVLDVPETTQYRPQPLVLAADSLDADDGDYSGGRQAFGNFKRKEKKSRPPPSKEGKEHGSDEEDEDDDIIVNPKDPGQTAKMLKQHEFREAVKARLKERSEPKLSQLTSISGTGRGSLVGGSPSSDKKKKKRKSR